MNVALRRAGAALFALWLFVPAAADDAPPAAAAKAPAPASTKQPVDMDGVLLDDGRQIEGAYEEKAGQRWVIHPKGGGADLNVSVVNVVIAEKGGFADVKGDDSAAFKVWRAASGAAYAAKKGGETDDAAKAAQIEALGKGVEWCKKREFATAATAILSEIGRLDPTKSADVEARAKELMPDGFFFKDAPDAVKQWMKWADALLPSSAEFVDKSNVDDNWSRLQNEPWTDGKTLCFRTRNVLLFIRDLDPVVCGKALQLAEGTVHALQLFLHDGEPDVVSSDMSRLEIRIHKNRADYLAEKPAHGKPAEQWSAGYFAGWEGISHFYIDRNRTKDGGVDYHELTRVLTHEFTHHYMTARWAAGKQTARGAMEMSGGEGFWVVEGMAEFVQNQMHKIDTRGLTFDDDDVTGVIDTAQARNAGLTSGYLEMKTFTDMSQASFQALSDDLLPGAGRKQMMVSERGLWYDQAGALCYFFIQKRGPEVRKKFVKYVEDHYAGIAHVPAWKYFGYASAEALDNDFLAFLRTVHG